MEMMETDEGPSRAIAVHPRLADKRWGEHASASRLHEFEQLVLSCDCELLGSEEIPIRKAVPSTLLGSGQAEKITDLVEEFEADVVFVDHALTPVQQQNLETTWAVKVVDRTGLILEIFGSRARTREGVLQVDLASLNYQLGRLVRSWTHLERQRGGHGFLGGPRKRHEVPTVALVGYTNAGKSTLFNRLTEGGVYVADQLFATLDPTLRKLVLPGGEALMLSDTVGFVQDLPHELVNAFRATLEEVIEADLILHVRDASDPESPMHKQVVLETLEELGLDGDHAPPIVEVLNKVDQAPEVKSRLLDKTDGSRVAVSALTGLGMDELLLLIRRWQETDSVECSVKLHVSDGKMISWCHENGRVLNQRTEDEYMYLTVVFSEKYAGMLNII